MSLQVIFHMLYFFVNNNELTKTALYGSIFWPLPQMSLVVHIKLVSREANVACFLAIWNWKQLQFWTCVVKVRSCTWNHFRVNNAAKQNNCLCFWVKPVWTENGQHAMFCEEKVAQAACQINQCKTDSPDQLETQHKLPFWSPSSKVRNPTLNVKPPSCGCDPDPEETQLKCKGITFTLFNLFWQKETVCNWGSSTASWRERLETSLQKGSALPANGEEPPGSISMSAATIAMNTPTRAMAWVTSAVHFRC